MTKMKAGIDYIGVGVGALIFNEEGKFFMALRGPQAKNERGKWEIPDEHQHWVSPTFICQIIKGEPTIKEPEKCSEIGWFSLEEAEKMPLSIVTRYDINKLKLNSHTAK